ncbi:MAG: hypothetical protein IT488_03300 [Gammaproteobacteria bacterium]|nr:hypothetical protein [Gammaproteobacteria bacterium]
MDELIQAVQSARPAVLANTIFAAPAIALFSAASNVARAITLSPTSRARRGMSMGPSWLLATTASEKHRQRQEPAFLTLNVAFVPTDHGLDIVLGEC